MAEHNPEFEKRYWTQQILWREASQYIPSEGENQELYDEFDEFDEWLFIVSSSTNSI